jgi:hypothetical protein
MFRIFLLSPANSSGRRAQLLFNERAQFRSRGGFAMKAQCRWLRFSHF